MVNDSTWSECICSIKLDVHMENITEGDIDVQGGLQPAVNWL
jgi:hypothetical protein